MAYSDEGKRRACALVKRNKGVIDDVLVETIRVALDAPKLSRTNIWRWWQHYQNMTVNSATNATEKGDQLLPVDDRELDVMFEDAARKFVTHALREELLIWTSAKDAMTAAGIAIDKMRLLRDLPTEIIGAAPELTELANFFREEGIEMSSAIRKWRERLQAKKASTKAGQAAVSNE